MQGAVVVLSEREKRLATVEEASAVSSPEDLAKLVAMAKAEMEEEESGLDLVTGDMERNGIGEQGRDYLPMDGGNKTEN